MMLPTALSPQDQPGLCHLPSINQRNYFFQGGDTEVKGPVGWENAEDKDGQYSPTALTPVTGQGE